MRFVWMGFLKSADPIDPAIQQQISGFLEQPYIPIDLAGVLRNPGGANLFVLNWLEFQGPGLSFSSTPYGGAAHSVPDTVQAEDFDNGGEGVAYHDTEPANFGGAYRNTGVDIQATTDVGGGYNVGWMAVGEWLKYSVNVTAAGQYTLASRVAGVVNGGVFHIEFNGIDKTGPVSVPNTGGWQTWQTVTLTNVVLDSGPQIMRLVMDSSGPDYVANFNWIQATLTRGNSPPAVALNSPPDQATYSAPATLTVGADATDFDGGIQKIRITGAGVKHENPLRRIGTRRHGDFGKAHAHR